MRFRLGATIVLVTLLATPGAATFDPARTFLMTAFNVTATSTDNAKLDMLATACFLILCSPEYLVQK